MSCPVSHPCAPPQCPVPGRSVPVSCPWQGCPCVLSLCLSLCPVPVSCPCVCPCVLVLCPILCAVTGRVVPVSVPVSYPCVLSLCPIPVSRPWQGCPCACPCVCPCVLQRTMRHDAETLTRPVLNTGGCGSHTWCSLWCLSLGSEAGTAQSHHCQVSFWILQLLLRVSCRSTPPPQLFPCPGIGLSDLSMSLHWGLCTGQCCWRELCWITPVIRTVLAVGRI